MLCIPTFCLAVALASDVPSHQVFGEAWSYDAMGNGQFLQGLQSSADGLNPSIARSIDHPLAKGSYSASASYVNGLPRFSLAADTKPTSTGVVGEVDAHYFANQDVVVSGFGATAPTKMNFLWSIAAGATGPTDVAYIGSNSFYYPKFADGAAYPGYLNSTPNFVENVVRTMLPNGFTATGTGLETFDLKDGGSGTASTQYNVWGYVMNGYGEGSGFLDMILDAITFPEFSDQTADELGWTVAFGPHQSPIPGGGGGGGSGGGGGAGAGGSPTPEPQSLLVFGALFLLAARSRRSIRAPR